MKVCIAEKPSVAKEIAAVIGANHRKDGFYEGNGYAVTWTFGHLCTLKEPNDYHEKWKWWSLNTLPILPDKFETKLIQNKGVEKQFNTIKLLVSQADEIINCGDAGQEGELIQRWVLNLAGCSKPVKRLWISSLTEEAIREGFNSLKDASQFDRLYHAGSSRAIGDWLLGMNATRLYTLKYGQNKQVLSVGRVQTPTLALIVNRHLEIENFVSQTFWELKTKYREVVFSSEEGRFYNKEEAENILTEIEGEPFTVVQVETKKGKEAPPRLFDLTSLQVECNKKFAFSADETLKTIQGLYEKKFVTYPRVDTTYLPNDIFPKIQGILKSLKAYGNLTQILLEKTIKKSNKVFDDKKVTDHHAIIPTDVTAQALSSSEEKIYDLIAKRFIAVFYPDCEVSNTIVKGQVKEREFKVSGRQILDMGWRAVYQKDTTIDEEAEEIQLLPLFVKGENGKHEPGLLEKQTQPPRLHTEATLLRAMETAGKLVDDEELRELMKDNGIGRPSTRAAVIETLFKRNYIRKERKNLVPTITGVELIKTIHNDLLKSAELTGQWEYKLRLIEKGEYHAGVFLTEMKKMVTELITEVKNEREKRISVFSASSEGEQKEKKDANTAKSKDQKCPKCERGNVIKGNTAFGCSTYKEGCLFKIPFTLFGKLFTDAQISQLIVERKSQVLKGFSIEGKLAEGRVVLNVNSEPNFEEVKKAKKVKNISDASPKMICPKCKSGEILVGNTAYGCSNWRNGCNLRVPFKVYESEIGLKEVQQLVKKGKTALLKGLLIDGKKESGKLAFSPEMDLLIEIKGVTKLLA